jgi:hypothetical protein
VWAAGVKFNMPRLKNNAVSLIYSQLKMNLILENSKYVEYYTDLCKLFNNIPELIQYNYLISDIEFNHCSDSRLHKNPVIIDGKVLFEIVKKEDIQFNWAVLSAFKSKIESNPVKVPFADGNSTFWQGHPKPQAPGAEFEIVCWDSASTFFINMHNDITEKLLKLFPDIKDLDKENESRG